MTWRDVPAPRTPERVARLVVAGEPRSKQRPRVTKRGTYTPPQTMEQESKIRDHWVAAGHARFEHPVIVDIDFYNSTKHRRDIDNMAKLVLDALNRLAFTDDYLVVGLNLRKLQTVADKARTEVTIREVILWPNEA